ncbi:hypothetical protein [Pseudomonas petrae]|uniref:Uncharacterized protein n=1 Tax=Pseudomonas petrae TaxID=2912190 RepID=A0ABS9I3U0_9PSED|nr:hypothetical protein [Pseudomonas petrae]MCF7541861.1 hypothetical protein [Pseudomonas petrae]
MSSRDQFESSYAECTGAKIEDVRSWRMGDSYRMPSAATAWRWWQRAKDAA